MKKFLVRIFISLLVLSQCVVWGLYFRQRNNAVRQVVNVQQLSYYALPVSQKDTLYFDDLSSDTISIVRVGRTSVQSHREQVGRLVTTDSKVQVVFPVRRLAFHGEQLIARLNRYMQQEKHRNQLRQHHIAELDYYAKTHSVVDEGYNEVMRYRSKLVDELSSSVRALELLDTMVVAAQKDIRVMQKTRAFYKRSFAVNGAPYAMTEDVAKVWWKNTNAPVVTGLVSIVPATQEQLPPTSVKTLRQTLLYEVDTTHLQFVDSLGQSYQLHLVNGNTKRWEGTQLSLNGDYYEGQFNGAFQRDGQGFAVERHLVKSGEWKSNRFRGERMVYTAQRVYGIDVSRHQHEHGKKRYPIHWDRLRITHLGSISKKKVSGAVDYPVSFVFIKATEGKSLMNKYYLSDLRGARVNGIPVAPYHFFTHLSSGLAQAKHFVKHVHLSQATLPPMLDVEPTNEQIAKMGGREVLFREMLVWLRYVEAVSHHRPILYVSQQFVNQHLSHAPEALRRYDVWIARYGEFKPYVKLTFWQLSPDGRVRGIHGDVDINVYNGTREGFEEWRHS